MAITNKEQGVWGVDQVFNKINEGGIWTYDGEKELWAWGKNDDGNLGQNDTPYRSSPVQVPGITWSSLSQAYASVAMIKTDGTAWMMGAAGGHTLCQNSPDNTTRSSPIQVGSATNYNSTGHASGTAVFFTKTNGELWACGTQAFGELGFNQNATNDNNSYSSPVQIPGTTWSQPFTSAMEVGYCMRTDGTLWAWGGNQYGNLGQNTGGNPGRRSSPVQIEGTTWSKLASSSRQTMAIKTDGTLWGWGNNHSGCLGMATHPEGDFHAHQKSISSPSQVPGTTWSDIGCAHFNSAAVKTDGTLWAWGKNQYGELGQNNRTSQSSPVQIPGTTWKTVRGGSQGIMYGQKTDGTLWAWGRNFYGSIGQNQAASPQSWSNSRSSPVQVPGTSWNLGGVSGWGNNASISILKNV